MPVFSLFLVSLSGRPLVSPLFFFNDTATTEIYTLSLHDALPIYEEIGAGIRIDNRLKTDLGFMHFKRRRAYEWISSRTADEVADHADVGVQGLARGRSCSAEPGLFHLRCGPSRALLRCG